MLSRKDILSKNELKKVIVSIPEWGGDVFVSEFSADVKDQWEQKLIEARSNDRKLEHPRATLVVITVVNEKGDPIFTEEDIPALAKLSAISLDKIIDEAQNLNGIGVDLEKVKKNS